MITDLGLARLTFGYGPEEEIFLEDLTRKKRALLLVWHPDKNPDRKKFAGDVTARILVQFSVLSKIALEGDRQKKETTFPGPILTPEERDMLVAPLPTDERGHIHVVA